MTKKPDKIDDAVRLKLARSRVNRMIDRSLDLLLMHESNALVIYTKLLSSQIPASRAGHAFNQFRASMHLYEILKLAAMWDGYDHDRESLPAIAALINKPAIIDGLVNETHHFFSHEVQPHNAGEPATQQAVADWWKVYRVERATEEADKTRKTLMEAITFIQTTMESPEIKALRRLRNASIAHHLDLPPSNPADPVEVLPLKYGDESIILDHTIKALDLLHLGVNGTSFQWEDSKAMAKNNAAELWNACHFDIPDRSKPPHRPEMKT